MGGQLSKSPNPLAAGGGGNGGIAATTNATTGSCNNSIEYVSELSSYEAVCLQDPELQSFDTTLQQRTSHVISTLIAGVDVHSLSFDTLREVTGCPLDTNQEVVKILLEYKKDIWKNPELFDRVEEYFESSLQTLDFCSSLEKCLKKARESLLIIIVAMKRFKEEDQSEEEKQNNGKAGKKKYEKTLEELRHFKAAGHPFTEEFFQAFQSVYRQQVSMLEKLQKKKRKLDKKLKTMKAWRKISTVIFVLAVVLICSVVTAAMNAPAVIAALAAFAASAMGPVGKWLNSLWKGYLDALKGQQEVLYNMQVRTYVRVSDLDSIRVLVDQLEVQISSLLQNVEFALREEDAVKFVIEEIKKKLEVFMRSAEELGKQADWCSRDIRRAGTVVLERIIRHPNSIGGGSWYAFLFIGVTLLCLLCLFSMT